MIKKLRIKFVMINMCIITIMLFSILGLIFFFTRQNLENESISMMKSIAIEPFALGQPDNTGDDVKLPYFVLRLGPMGELITAHGGYYELSNDSFLRELADTVLASQKHLGTLNDYNLRYYKSENPLSPCIVFADMSSETATLHSLLITCCVIGIIGFCIFMELSILLSYWVAAPIDIAFRKQRQFIADASHELKTPLTVILTNTELMDTAVTCAKSCSGDTSQPATAFNNKTAIQNNTAIQDKPAFQGSKMPGLIVSTRTMSLRMKELISHMLELAKTEPDTEASKKSSASFTDINLTAIAEDTAMTFDAVFFEHGRTLHTEIDEAIHISGDKAMLTELIEIFLDNACKYSSDSGNTWLTLKRCDKSHCILSVSNEGPQISSHDLKNLFTRFYRADYSRSLIPGSGLGLSIAANIAALHGTAIKADSYDGINRFQVKFHTIFT